MKFRDGLVSMVNKFINLRAAANTNQYQLDLIDHQEMAAIIMTGLGSKIVKIKGTYPLKNTLQFSTDADEKYFNRVLLKHVKQASMWMVGYGRGAILLHHKGDDLSKPLGKIDREKVIISVFDGEICKAIDGVRDLQDPRYGLPRGYNIRGNNIHYSRIVDFTYVKPPEQYRPQFNWGGISEFQLIYEQLVADGVVQRACPQIIDKASTMFYKMEGFKDMIASGEEEKVGQYITSMESMRGLFSAGVIDKEDDVEAVSQVISNLSDADQITLRRIAMVTGIPMVVLVEATVGGLNSSNENSMEVYQEMKEGMQEDYLYDPINELARKFEIDEVWFKENQSETAEGKADYDNKVITNAKMLHEMGEDHSSYLDEKNIIKKDNFSELFGETAD